MFPNSAHPDPAHPYGYTVDEFSQLVNAAQTASDNNACTEAVHCQKYGDTTYITLPTTNLPLLAPIRFIGERLGISAVTRPLTDLIEPALKVLIETGYDRTSYGTPTPFQIVMPLNPQKVLTLLPDLAKATVQGIQDAIGDITGTRPAPAPTQDPFATAVSLFTDGGGLAPVAGIKPVAAQTSLTTNKSTPPSTPLTVNLTTSTTTPTDPGATTKQPSSGDSDGKTADNPDQKATAQQDQSTPPAKGKPEKKSKNDKAKTEKLGKGKKTEQGKHEKGSDSAKLGDKSAADGKSADKESTSNPAGTPAKAVAQN